MSSQKKRSEMMGRIHALKNYIFTVKNTTVNEICNDLQFSKTSAKGYLDVLIAEKMVIKNTNRKGRENKFTLGSNLSEFDVTRGAFSPSKPENQKVKFSVMKALPAPFKFMLRGEFETYLFGEAKYQTDISRILAAGYADCVGGV